MLSTVSEVNDWTEQRLLERGQWKPGAMQAILDELRPYPPEAASLEIIYLGCHCAEATLDHEKAVALRYFADVLLKGLVEKLPPSVNIADETIERLAVLVQCCRRARLAWMRAAQGQEGRPDRQMEIDRLAAELQA